MGDNLPQLIVLNTHRRTAILPIDLLRSALINEQESQQQQSEAKQDAFARLRVVTKQFIEGDDPEEHATVLECLGRMMIKDRGNLGMYLGGDLATGLVCYTTPELSEYITVHSKRHSKLIFAREEELVNLRGGDGYIGEFEFGVEVKSGTVVNGADKNNENISCPYEVDLSRLPRVRSLECVRYMLDCFFNYEVDETREPSNHDKAISVSIKFIRQHVLQGEMNVDDAISMMTKVAQVAATATDEQIKSFSEHAFDDVTDEDLALIEKGEFSLSDVVHSVENIVRELKNIDVGDVPETESTPEFKLVGTADNIDDIISMMEGVNTNNSNQE